LGKHEDDYVGRFGAGNGVEELGQSQQKTSDRSNDDDADDNEGYLLRPELDIELKAEVVDGNFKASRDGIGPSHSIKYDVDSRYEDFPHAVDREKISQCVKVASFERLGINYSLLMIA